MLLEQSTLSAKDNHVILDKREEFHLDENMVMALCIEYLPTILLGVFISVLFFSVFPNMVQVFQMGLHSALIVDYTFMAIKEDFLPSVWPDSGVPKAWAIPIAGAAVATGFHTVYSKN
jgi:hypothetical protein